MVAARGECGLNCPYMVFEEQHGGNHDIAGGDIGMTVRQGPRIAAPFIGRVNHNIQVRNFATQFRFGPRSGTGQMTIHGDDHHAQPVLRHHVQGGHVTVHNAPSRRKVCPT